MLVVVERDPDLPHQPVLMVRKRGKAVVLTCNCGCDLGITHDFEETVCLFNSHLASLEYREFHLGHVRGLCDCD